MLDYENLSILNSTGQYLVALLAAVLNKSKIPPLPSELTWENVYNLAKAHSVDVLAFEGVKDLISDETELYKKWKKRRDQNIVQDIVQYEEQNRIFKKFYKQGIVFLPLKGFTLKKLYKQTYFRQMSDLDILIDYKDAENVKQIMELMGYDTYEYGETYNDGYFLYPYINVEIHKNMLPDDINGYEYYSNIWKKVVPDPLIPGAMQLSLEDFYIYYLIHFAKHYNNLGSGIRSLMDIYIYLQMFQNKMDKSYINKELDKLNLLEFCSLMERLSNHWFAQDISRRSDDTERVLMEIERNIFLAGVYGSREYTKVRLMSEYKKEGELKSNVKYIWNRIFMSKKEFGYAYPITEKYSILIPVFWIYRIFDVLVHKRKAIKKEIELFLENNK